MGLSRTRLDGRTLAEAGRVLDEAAARHRLSLDHTVVAVAGATGSGKSTLFNALAGGTVSEAGVRRPTTSAPIACAWSDGAEGLLDRLGIPVRLRRRPLRAPETAMRGLVLIDLPDHDSAVPGRREQVDRLLGLVDAVLWVVDPEKYADAALHERYLRPLAGYAEVTFVVLNQIDRLPGDSADHVLDDLRRLLDEDGLALGEHGEPGATVLAVSALTGHGIADLREQLGRFVAERGAPERRVAADLAGAIERLRTVYLADGWVGLTEAARAEFEHRLADAVGAVAAGQAAEREWLRQAELACGAPWAQVRRWYQERRGDGPARVVRPPLPAHGPAAAADRLGGDLTRCAARPMVEHAVRRVAEDASAGLPEPWALAVREAAVRGAERLPEALDAAAAGAAKAAAAVAGGGPAREPGAASGPGATTASGAVPAPMYASPPGSGAAAAGAGAGAGAVGAEAVAGAGPGAAPPPALVAARGPVAAAVPSTAQSAGQLPVPLASDRGAMPAGRAAYRGPHHGAAAGAGPSAGTAAGSDARRGASLRAVLGRERSLERGRDRGRGRGGRGSGGGATGIGPAGSGRRGAPGAPGAPAGARGTGSAAARSARPGWWSAAAAVQGLLMMVQIVGALWLIATVITRPGYDDWWEPALMMAWGVALGPVVAWVCRLAARGPARRYGQEAERRLRGAAAACGRARVLEPIAAELLRYQEVRDQYLVAAGGPGRM
ncbi:GTPase [Streptomyces sp. URMC 123]|uniref:GTPase n=1 Tax=Streptomyces sp. URMC 123 TaxID=3423403 RepID=UPI003F1A6800